MRILGKTDDRGRSGRGVHSRDGLQALTACGFLAGLFALGIFLGVGTPASLQPSATSRQASGVPRTAADDDLSTGSILFVPVLGNRCRHRLIDNATWRIVDAGIVDCATTLSRARVSGPKWSAARVDVVRDGFRMR